MKVKDLIKALQVCDPDTRVNVNFERSEDYRMEVIKTCISKGDADILTQMEIDCVALEQGLQGEDENTISCILYVKAGN